MSRRTAIVFNLDAHRPSGFRMAALQLFLDLTHPDIQVRSLARYERIGRHDRYLTLTGSPDLTPDEVHIDGTRISTEFAPDEGGYRLQGGNIHLLPAGDSFQIGIRTCIRPTLTSHAEGYFLLNGTHLLLKTEGERGFSALTYLHNKPDNLFRYSLTVTNREGEEVTSVSHGPADQMFALNGTVSQSWSERLQRGMNFMLIGTVQWADAPKTSLAVPAPAAP